jgi:hypothetical protein
MTTFLNRKASTPKPPLATSIRYWSTTEEVLTIPAWFANRGAVVTRSEGEVAYSFPFVGLTLDAGVADPVLPLGAYSPRPVMGRVIMASSRGEPINLATAIKGTFTTEAEDWMLYCSSPAVPWSISASAMAHVDEERGGSVVIPVSSPRASVVAALQHYGLNPRYQVALSLAMVIQNAGPEDLVYDAVVARRCRLSDFPVAEYRGLTGHGTVTLVGRDDVS